MTEIPFDPLQASEFMIRREAEPVDMEQRVALATQIDTISQALRILESNGQADAGDTMNIFPAGAMEALDPRELHRLYPQRFALFSSLLEAGFADPEELAIHLTEAMDETAQKDMLSWLSMMNGLDDYLIAEGAKLQRWIGNGRREDDLDRSTLKEKQLEVFGVIREKVEQGKMSGYVKLPTGVGKTALFTELVEAAGGTTVIVVPTIDLVDQTKEAFAKFAPDLAVDTVWGGSKKRTSHVVVITVDSLGSAITEGIVDPENTSMLVLDEVQRYLTDERVDLVNRFTKSLRLGFTATPAFNDQKNVENRLKMEQFFGLDIQEAINPLGLISSFRNIVVRTSADFSQASVTAEGNVSSAVSEHQLNTDLLNNQAVDLYEKYGNNQAAIANCSSIPHAHAVAAAHRARGISAEVIEGEMSKDERVALKKRVSTGEVKVLCGDQLTIEGLDIVEVGLVMNLAPTWSRVVCEQRGGRGLRLYAPIPLKTIIDCIPAKYPPHQRPLIFADVAGRAEIHSPDYQTQRAAAASRGEPQTQEAPFTLLGGSIISDPEEVMVLVTPDNAKADLEVAISKLRPSIITELNRRQRAIAAPAIAKLLHGDAGYMQTADLAYVSGTSFKTRQEHTAVRGPHKQLTTIRGQEHESYNLEFVRDTIRQDILKCLLPLFHGGEIQMPSHDRLMQELQRLEADQEDQHGYNSYVEAYFFLRQQRREKPVLDEISDELLLSHPFAERFKSQFS